MQPCFPYMAGMAVTFFQIRDLKGCTLGKNKGVYYEKEQSGSPI